MREADLDEVIGIEKRSFVAPWSKRLFRETLSFPLSFNLVIRKKVDNKVAGYANFYVIGDEVQVLNIAVAPESRREGYSDAPLAPCDRRVARPGSARSSSWRCARATRTRSGSTEDWGS